MQRSPYMCQCIRAVVKFLNCAVYFMDDNSEKYPGIIYPDIWRYKGGLVNWHFCLKWDHCRAAHPHTLFLCQGRWYIPILKLKWSVDLTEHGRGEGTDRLFKLRVGIGMYGATLISDLWRDGEFFRNWFKHESIFGIEFRARPICEIKHAGGKILSSLSYIFSRFAMSIRNQLKNYLISQY